MFRDFLRLNARSLVAVLVLAVAPFVVDSLVTAWLYQWRWLAGTRWNEWLADGRLFHRHGRRDGG